MRSFKCKNRAILADNKCGTDMLYHFLWSFSGLSFRAMLHISLVVCRCLCRSLRFFCVCACMTYSALCGTAWHLFLMVFSDCHSVVGEQFNFLMRRPPGQKIWKLQWFTGELRMLNCSPTTDWWKWKVWKRDCSEPEEKEDVDVEIKLRKC